MANMFGCDVVPGAARARYLTSYMARNARESEALVPDLEKSRGDEAYEGAIVLPPPSAKASTIQWRVWISRLCTPSSMISRNLSHDSKVSGHKSLICKEGR
jgi:hypothetical protein